MSSVGVSFRDPLLVHQRDHLRWRGSKGLARKDEDMQVLRGFGISLYDPLGGAIGFTLINEGLRMTVFLTNMCS